MTRLEPVLELLEAVPSAGRIRALLAIARAGELGPVGVLEAGAAPTLGIAAYHVRKLASDGLVALLRTEPRRGAVAHFYGITAAGLNALEGIEALARALEGPRTALGRLSEDLDLGLVETPSPAGTAPWEATA